MVQRFVLLLLLFNLPLSAFTQEITHLDEESRFDRVMKDIDIFTSSPFFLNDSIAFFYRGKAQKVLIAGSFNDWNIQLLMTKKTNNLWVYYLTLPLTKGIYQYKFVVDDIWIPDPNNTNFILDPSGQKVSVFTLDHNFYPQKHYPLHLKSGKYRFRYEDNHARNVALVGSFNNWNPFANPMTYKGAGVFELDMDLKSGFQIYCFVVDEQWIPDPYNHRQYSDELDNIVNVIHIPKASKF